MTYATELVVRPSAAQAESIREVGKSINLPSTDHLLRVAVLGSSGHASDFVDVVEAISDKVGTHCLFGLLAPSGSLSEEFEGRENLLRGDDSILAAEDVQFVVAVNEPDVRKRIALSAESLGREPALLVHPDASVSSAAELEPGVVVHGGARISGGVRLRRHSYIGQNATVGHGSTIGRYASILPGANIAGRVNIGEGVQVGSGAFIRQGLTVGDRAVVGAGAVVTKNVDSWTTVVGTPARPLIKQ